jgi:malate dehydrogenase (oxaloacetate-decarboxylating)(NADP+)
MIKIDKRGHAVLRDPRITKSTAFTAQEREYFGLRGLIPHAVGSQERQIRRVIANIRSKESSIEKYIFLSALQDRNVRLFYKVILENVEELLPIIYTPTVGEACIKFSHIYTVDKGFFITPDDRGEVIRLIDNWPTYDVRVIVITDGNRILGLGDLGSNGIGIPIGKLSLYSAMGGIDPDYCMPIMFDVGTNNEELLNDPLYLGYPHKRLTGDDYFSLLDEFVAAVKKKFPYALIQFEDFLTPNAYAILQRYRDDTLCFNDDIQGTASVALSGVYCASRITKIPFTDTKILFLGAGAAATGIADLMVHAFIKQGLTEDEARERLWFVDIDGLITQSRTNLMAHNVPFAHDAPPMTFKEALRWVKPNVLIGASGAYGAFDEEVFEIMGQNNEIPVVFALSNPTSKSECTAEQAYTWSKGRVVFASGSPFEPFEYEGKTFHTGQGNNVYIFPGIGLACLAIKPKVLPEEVFLVAAETLAQLISESDLSEGRVYPKLTEMRQISFSIAYNVSKLLFEMQLAQIELPNDLGEHIKSHMFDPTY